MSLLAFCPTSHPYYTPMALLFKPLNDVRYPAGQMGGVTYTVSPDAYETFCLLLQDWQLNLGALQGPTFSPLPCKPFLL